MRQFSVAPLKRPMAAAVISIIALAVGGCASIMLLHPLPDAVTAANVQIPQIPKARFDDQLFIDPVAVLRSLKEFGSNRTTGEGKLAYDETNLACSTSGGRPVVNILAISGGGPDGAFAAGLITGWGKTDKRPRFQIVTGVSAGALIAPFVFLGNKKNDELLETMWRVSSIGDLTKFQVFTAIFGGTALSKPLGLISLIDKHVTQELLNSVADEYRNGRLLLIGTTNIHTGRPVIWNMGEIAAAAKLELFRKIMLASAAVPFLFPPVTFNVVDTKDGKSYEEVHVDGGVTKNAFIGPERLNLRKLAALYSKKLLFRIYVIRNAKMGVDFDQVQFPTIFQIGKRSMDAANVAYNNNNIERIYNLTEVGAGNGQSLAQFRLAAVPQEFVLSKSMFDTQYQTRLFDLGQCLVDAGRAWEKKPPGVDVVASSRPKDDASSAPGPYGCGWITNIEAVQNRCIREAADAKN